MKEDEFRERLANMSDEELAAREEANAIAKRTLPEEATASPNRMRNRDAIGLGAVLVAAIAMTLRIMGII